MNVKVELMIAIARKAFGRVHWSIAVVKLEKSFMKLAEIIVECIQ